MVANCCVVGCSTVFKKNSGISFHVIPKDPARRHKWLRAIKRENLFSSDYVGVCSKHFLPTDYKNDEFGYLKKCLRNDAVPSIFPTLTPKLKRGFGPCGGKERQIGAEDTPPIPPSNDSNESLKVNTTFLYYYHN